MSIRSLLSPLVFLFVFLVAARMPAQDLRFVHPEKYERATKTDEAGMLQWDVHQELKCLTCSGTGKMKCITCERFPDDEKVCIECKRTKEAVCRACAGAGTFADPLEKCLCPGCQGSAFLLCQLCSGTGNVKEEGANRPSACPACREEGGWKCTVCDGVRLVEVAALKPSLKEANAAALTKALQATDQQLAAFDKFTPTGGKNLRKEAKEMVKHLAIAQQVFPPMKRTTKFFDTCLSKTYGGSRFQNQEERELAVLTTIKGSTQYFLKHQKRMLELAHKRAEANEKLAAENKGK